MAAAAPDRYGANAPPLIPLDDGPSPPAAAAAAGGAPAVGGSSRPKGILKNASSSAVKTVSGGSTHGAAAGLASGSSSGQHAPASGSGAATGDVAMDDGVAGEPERGLTWDEENLARTEAEKDSQMKITEPKTPYVQYDALNDMVLSEVPGFDLGTLNGQPSPSDVLASPPNGPSPPTSSHPSMPSSRSTSFSLPASEHPSSSLATTTAAAAGGDALDVGSPLGGSSRTVLAGEVEEDEEELTAEQEAKHREFVKARGRHYSNEGEAMRRSKELLEKELAEEEDDDDDDDEKSGGAMDGIEAAAPATNGLRLDGL